MRLVLAVFLVFGGLHFAYAQDEDTTVSKTQDLMAVRYDRNFDLHYAQKLNQIRRTYPLALRAKEVIDSLDIELEGIDKKRKRKKISKKRKKQLEEELQYLIKDLYVSEGKMLFKLIHRETGMTVTEILAKYRGKVYSKTIKATFSLYGHNTSSKFDAEGDDWLAEMILRDIEAGHRLIDMNIQVVDKAKYKQNMKDYRDYRKTRRKEGRESRKNKRKASRKNQDLASE